MCSTIQSVVKNRRRSSKHHKRPSLRFSRTGAILRPRDYSEAEKRLANLARKVAAGRDVLYHGTRYAQSILRLGVVFRTKHAGRQVCLTRSPEEAARWALLERDDDEGRGAILIFDRQSLRSRYKIQPYHDRCWDTGTICIDEGEEKILADITDVGKHLVGYVSDSSTRSSARLGILNSKSRMAMEARLKELLRRVPDWRWRPRKQVELAIPTHELACKALSEGAGIPEVVERLRLPIGTVRRFAGQLQPKDFRRSIAQIALSWILIDLLQQNPTKISASKVASLLGTYRVNLLMTYSGLPRDDLLNRLSRDLSLELMQIRNSAETFSHGFRVGESDQFQSAHQWESDYKK